MQCDQRTSRRRDCTQRKFPQLAPIFVPQAVGQAPDCKQHRQRHKQRCSNQAGTTAYHKQHLPAAFSLRRVGIFHRQNQPQHQRRNHVERQRLACPAVYQQPPLIAELRHVFRRPTLSAELLVLHFS